MEIILPIVLFACALILILKGGDYLVDGAIWLARVTRIPDMVIGATVVSLATTLPEVLVSSMAVATGTAGGVDFGINNGTGSMIFNILVILGLAATIRPSDVERKSFIPKAVLLTLFTAMLILFSISGGVLDKIESVILIVCFLVFMGYNVWEAKKGRAATPPVLLHDAKPAWLNILFLLVGTACIGFGAKLLVDNGITIAQYFGVSEAIIGLTIVAAGTSLPELVTTIKSLKKGKGSIGVGNIIGANIINCTLLVGLCGVISGPDMAIGGAALLVTLPALIISTLLLFLPTAVSGQTKRWQGIAMLTVFAAYITVMILNECGYIPI